MPLNSYFLQGSPSEQRLVQDLINEQLRMYGQDVLYIPRKIVNENTIIREITSSRFDDSYRIEAYLLNYEGFGDGGDILSKFGVRNTDEINLVISKERYDDFITPLLNLYPQNEIKLTIRPEEGDLIFFPLDQSLFEIKFVQSKKPFYQLNQLYVYELRCERFEYEDEIIDISEVGADGEPVNELVKDFGNIYEIFMVGSSATPAIGTVSFASTLKGVQYIDLISDGSGYLATPTVTISPPPLGGIQATAVAITRSLVGQRGSSISKILLTNPGYGYTQPPTVSITGGGGSGGIATAVISSGVLGPVLISYGGVGYSTIPPTVTIQPSGITTSNNAQAEAVLNTNGYVVQVRYSNAGSGYTSIPSITFSSPASNTFGDYVYGQEVTGTQSGTVGYVKDWDGSSRILKVSTVDGVFIPGESIVGTGVSYKVLSVKSNVSTDNFAENIQLEEEGNAIIDFSETNPFGES